MKYLSLLFIVLFSFVNAQDQRFSYEYKFAPDGNKLDKVLTEMMVLDVTSEGSHFYSYDKMVSDSMMYAMIEKQIKNSSSIDMTKMGKRGVVNFDIKKSYPNYKVEFKDQFGGYTYQVNDTRKLKWKVSPETQKIGEWDCQKATTEFGGRTWEVWFTSSIPINDGPYKFHSLPGLIVKAECEDASHQFLLVGAKKLPEYSKNNEVKKKGFSFLSSKQPITLSLKKYAKQKEKHLKDPTAYMRQLMGSGAMVSVSFNGKKMSNAEMIKEMEKNNKEKKQNLIEKDFLK